MSEAAVWKVRTGRRWRGVALALALVVGGIVGTGAVRMGTGPATGAGLSGAEYCANNEKARLRVALLNIHSGVGADNKLDLDRTAEALGGFDVAGLNEVRGAGRSADQAELLGRKLKMGWLFAASERMWWRDSFGNGLLCSRAVERWERIPLAGSWSRGKKNVASAEVVVVGGGRVRVLVTHIDRQGDRVGQLRTVAEMFLKSPAPVILMGDFNTRRDDPAMKELLAAEGVGEAVGWKLGKADRGERIEWMISRGLKILDGGVSDNGASDHPVVWGEYEVESR